MHNENPQQPERPREKPHDVDIRTYQIDVAKLTGLQYATLDNFLKKAGAVCESAVQFNGDEESMNQLLLDFMQGLKEWGLSCNQEEMIAAVHVLQGFVINHMLQRLNPQQFISWYTPNGSTQR